MQAIASRLLAALVYPRSPSDFVDLAAPLRGSSEVRAEVVEIRRETHDVVTLRLAPNGRWRGHRAGQHTSVTAEIDGVRRTRFFSVASADAVRETIEITIKARLGGLVTPRLVFGARRGDAITLSQAQGDFVLPDRVPERLLLLSGGSGITPVMSMLRTLIARGHEGEIQFVHFAKSDADVIFRDELVRLGRAAPRGLHIGVRLGPFDAQTLETAVPGFEIFDTWACGPEPMLAAVQEAFASRDAAVRLRVERFSLATSNEDAGDVVFARSGRRTSGNGPLLVMAEQAGLSPAHGCRVGVCRTCMCRKVSGVTRDVRTGQLSTESDVDVQLCVSAPVGPVALDL
jgi:stearoyl-CoA 9-desaturase NADPH oxidoreductase